MPVAALLVVAGVIAGVLLSRDSPSTPSQSGAGSTGAAAAPPVTSADQIAGLATYQYAGGQHVTTPVDYTESPPVGGPHDNEWADCTGTVYDVDIRHENAVHGLEHGAVWITYDPDTIADGDLDVLEGLVEGRQGMMLSPYAGLKSPISLQSWNHQLFVDSASDERVEQYIDFMVFNADFTPEPGASCENPDFLTDPLVAGDASRRGGSTSTDAPAGAVPGSTGATVACDYVPVSSPEQTGVGAPPDPGSTPAQGTARVLMRTGQGELELTLDRSVAPCAAASFVHLAQQGFFDGSRCHREVNEPTFGVLQCGDPTGTGVGGPGYRFAQEVGAATGYPRGTVAMANSGSPVTTGSQFFLCFTDTLIPPDYTVVGAVDAGGLAVLDTIAAAGDDGSLDPSPGGGAPRQPVVIESMTVAG